MQVKGGRYLLINGEWYLPKLEGLHPAKSCPLDETKLAALDIHDDIEELGQTSYNPYVIPVLVFPDMTEPDAQISGLGRRQGVYVIWGVENLVHDLQSIAQSRSVSDPLPADRIAREIHGVTDGLIRLADVKEVDLQESELVRGTFSAVTLILNGLSIVRIQVRKIRCRLRVTPDKSTASAYPERNPSL